MKNREKVIKWKEKTASRTAFMALVIGAVASTFILGTQYALAGDPHWTTETVDAVDQVGPHTSLALDSGDNPHISYYDGTNGDLKYAYYDGWRWRTETVDNNYMVGLYTSIALDRANNPHISYQDATNYLNRTLKYAYYYGVWHTETVDVGDVGEWTSIAVDSHNRPHISYYAWGYMEKVYDLRYAYYDGTSWHIKTVDSAGSVGWHSSITLDSGDNPHISYYDWTNGDLKYAYYDGASWHTETVDSDAGAYTSIALDSGDNPHISYWHTTHGELRYAYYDGTSWHIKTHLHGGWHTSIALDSHDDPHISYYRTNPGDLEYAYYDGASWHIETVDSSGDVGMYTSIALDGSDNPRISYFDYTNYDLKYAFRKKLPPSCVVSPRSLDFGSVTVGDIADKDFTITNEGEETLSGQVSESCQYFSLVGDVSYSLGPGESHTFTVRFNPLTDGEYHCIIQTGTDCESLPSVGIGEYLPDCELSTTSLNFGTVTVGYSLDKSFSITNTGGGRLQGEIEESCPDFQLVTSRTYDLAGGDSKTFWVRFKPLSAGTKNCTIETGNPLCNDLPCTGIGEDPPECVITPTSLDFGTVAMGHYEEKQFTIRNDGGGMLSGEVSVSSDHFTIISSTIYDLGQGQQQNFIVRFEPQSSGNFDCTVQTGNGDCDNVSCIGVGYYYFIHLTDPHIGTTGAFERFWSVIDSINMFIPEPEFVVISGDLTHWGGYDLYWKTFLFLIDQFEVSQRYVCVGNHDYRRFPNQDKPWENPSYEEYFEDYDDHPTDNLHLISMNSGKDADVVDLVWDPWTGDMIMVIDILPEATGLSSGQMTWLTSKIDDYPTDNKIIFMHHPIVCDAHRDIPLLAEDDSNGCITQSRDQFMNLCRQHEAKVVLGGHTHEPFEYVVHYHGNIPVSLGEPPNGEYWSTDMFSKSLLPFYIITDASSQHLAYRRIEVIGDQVKVYKNERFHKAEGLAEYKTDIIPWPIPREELESLAYIDKNAAAPGRLHVLDSYGNHVGFNAATGEIALEIDMAYYEDETVAEDTDLGPFWTPSELISLLLDPNESYTYVVEIFVDCMLNVYGHFIEKNDAGEISTIYSNIPVSDGAIGMLFIDNDQVHHTLYIDDDGDGDFDRGIPPDKVVSPHDVTVSNISLSDSVVRQGDSLMVYVYVENQGNYPETFDVSVYACGDMFFDPFWVLNTDAWSYYSDDVPQDSVSVSGGLLHVRGTILPFLDAGLTSITEFDYPITVQTKLRSIYNYHCSPRLLFGTESNPCYIELCYDTWDDGWHIEYIDITGTHLVNWEGSISTETWYNLKLIIDETNFKAYLDDTLKVDRDWSPPDEYRKVVSLTSSCGMIGSGDFDWVKVQSAYDTKIAESTVVDLAPGESTIVSFKWSTKGITAGYYTIRSQAQQVQGEMDLSDNTFTSGEVRISACGDCNADENVDISDVVSIINYLLRDGPEPLPVLCVGDVKGDGEVSLTDVVYLINYVLKSGPPPVDYCCAR